MSLQQSLSLERQRTLQTLEHRPTAVVVLDMSLQVRLVQEPETAALLHVDSYVHLLLVSLVVVTSSCHVVAVVSPPVGQMYDMGAVHRICGGFLPCF